MVSFQFRDNLEGNKSLSTGKVFIKFNPEFNWDFKNLIPFSELLQQTHQVPPLEKKIFNFVYLILDNLVIIPIILISHSILCIFHPW